MEAYSAAVGSCMAKELTEERGDLLTALAPLPLIATGPLIVPFPLPFPLPPFKDKTKADDTRGNSAGGEDDEHNE